MASSPQPHALYVTDPVRRRSLRRWLIAGCTLLALGLSVLVADLLGLPPQVGRPVTGVILAGVLVCTIGMGFHLLRWYTRGQGEAPNP
jgi:hypothetical protein